MIITYRFQHIYEDKVRQNVQCVYYSFWHIESGKYKKRKLKSIMMALWYFMVGVGKHQEILSSDYDYSHISRKLIQE